MIRDLADNTNKNSLASRLRRARFERFLSLLGLLEGTVTLLDVGGTPKFWEMTGFKNDRFEITILNQTADESNSSQVRSVVGDARDLRQFSNGEFDVVFSNSVIEHVGGIADQQQMAAEVRRVGKRYWVQTPNRWFPIEPHFLFPWFQFLPLSVRAFLLTRFSLGWHQRTKDFESAMQQVSGVRLLSKRELRALFPDGDLFTERFMGLAKSFVVYGGWSKQQRPIRN